MCCAYYLSLAGWRVTLVDRGEIGRGCSYGNASLIVPSHSHPLPAPGVFRQALRWMGRRDSPFYIRPRFDPGLPRWIWQFRRHCTREAARHGFDALLRMSRASLELYEELARSHGFFFQRRGLLHVYLSDRESAAALREGEELGHAGFQTRLLWGTEAREFEPALGTRVRGALFIEGEAHADSYGFVQAMAAACEAQGVTVLDRHAVAGLGVVGGRARSVVVQPASREQAAEELRADLIVLAAGAWTPAVASPLGIRIPMQPAKGYSCTIDADGGVPAVPVLIPERRVIITPLGRRLRFAGTLELGGFDLGIDRRRYEAVTRGARGVLREPPQMRGEEAWCGLRPLTPDGLPVIDRVRGIEGLIVATGHAMLGLTLAPISGKIAAELAAGMAPSVPIEPFRLDRFA